jgi:hypothetical protein
LNGCNGARPWFACGDSIGGFLVAAFDKLEGAILFYALSLLFSLWVLWPASQDRRLFRKLKLLYERTKSG